MPRHLSYSPLAIVVCFVVGVCIVRICDLVTIDHDETVNFEKVDRETLHMGDSFEHLMWFVQITDLHLSAFSDRDRIDQLKEFCSVNLRAIQPKVVLASGDLTDGKTRNGLGSRQFEEEWRIYKDTLLSTSVLAITKWLDIRGNHDNFDVASINSSENFFKKYSVQGPLHPRSYIYHYVDGSDKYSFISVDACLDPGPRRPFNFVGLIDENEMRILEKYESEAQESNGVIWFGHYPTSSIFSPSPGIRHLMRSGNAYLCGHYHTFFGFVPNMYAFQKSGLLELELGDWKDSRLYRVAAFDHDLFSFVDVKHSEWPVILITNPKHALYMNPVREPVHRIYHSTNIRILVFSPKNISKVNVRINSLDWEPCVHVKGPLYTYLWSPDVFAHGLHTITVHVEEVNGTVKVISQPFSLDGTRVNFNFLSRLVVMGFLPVLLQILLGLSICLAVLPLCWIRFMDHYIRVGKLARPRYTMNCSYSLMRKMWLVATIDRIFYPLVVMALYVPLGPWFVGHIVENHIGVCFAWGMLVNGAFLPGGVTFAHAFLHMVIFNLPLMFLLAKYLDFRYRHLMTGCHPRSFISYFLHHLPMVIFLVLNAYIAYLAIPTYGTMAFLLNPFQTWSFLIAILLWKSISYIPESHFRHMYGIFPLPEQASHRDDLLSGNHHFDRSLQ